MTKEEVLEKNGFSFEWFKFDNEHSAKNLLAAMEEYASIREKEAFEAARETEFNDNNGVIGKFEGKKYPTLEDYLSFKK